MQRLDLNRSSKYKVERIINQEYGGRYSRKEKWERGGVGAGGFIYEEEGDFTQEFVHFKCNFELLKNGLIVYFSNLEDKHILLFNFDEIESIAFIKKVDVLLPHTSSLFKSLIAKEMNYFKAKFVLLDKYIEEEYQPTLKIEAKGTTALNFKFHKNNPGRAITFFNQLSTYAPVHIDVQTFEWKN